MDLQHLKLKNSKRQDRLLPGSTAHLHSNTHSSNGSNQFDFYSNPIYQNLSREHAENIKLEIGKRWISAKEATQAVQDFALLIQKKRAMVHPKKHGGTGKTFICSCTMCPWFVRVSKDKKRGDWYITRMELNHVNCTGVPKATCRQISELHTFSNSIQADQSISTKTLYSKLKSTHGISGNRSMVYRAKDAVVSKTRGDINYQYKLIPSLLEEFKRLNPQSSTEYVVNEDGRFLKAFIMPGIMVDLFPALQPILGCHTEEIKGSHKASYIHIQLSGRDGNFEPILLASAVCCIEDAEMYTWFFGNVIRAGLSLDKVAMLVDPKTTLQHAAEQFGIPLLYSTQHLIENMRSSKAIPTLGAQEQLIWEAQSAESPTSFEAALGQLNRFNSAAVMYLRQLSVDAWALHATVYEIPRFGWFSTSFIESNATMNANNGSNPHPSQGLLKESPLYMILNQMEIMMDHLRERQVLSDTMLEEKRIITLGAARLFDEQLDASNAYEVQASNRNLLYVWHCEGSPPKKSRVLINERQCTCCYYVQYGIPCCHYIAAMRHLKQEEGLFECFLNLYQVSNFAHTFGKEGSSIQIPLIEELIADETIRPAPRKPPNERRRKRKRLDEDGNIQEPRLAYKCRNCGMLGHNRKTCPDVDIKEI